MDKSVINFLKTKSLSTIETENIEQKLETWKQWYNSKVDGFHNYYVYDGNRKKNRTRLTLNMPARVCQDWADLLLNEKVEISSNDENTERTIRELLQQVNFYVRGNNLIEKAFALGGGFFIPYWDGEKTAQKYITQDFAYPITYDSGRLLECAFASNKTLGGKRYTYIEVHTKTSEGFYVIDSFICESNQKGTLHEVGASFYDKFNIAQKVITQSKIPLFTQIRPNIANRDVFDSSYGTSIFSGVTDYFAGADLCYDAYINEIKLGKKRIFVDGSVSKINIHPDGSMSRVFDPNDDVFYSMADLDEAGKPILESNMQLRVNELDTALQTQLNLISQGCGFGANGYKWDSGNVSTATQVISENSKMFRTMKKHELLLNDAIINMAKGLLYVEKTNNPNAKINLDAELSVDFDDSIIEDTAEIKRQATSELTLGLISKAEYFRKTRKMSEDSAIEFVKQMSQEQLDEALQAQITEEPPTE